MSRRFIAILLATVLPAAKAATFGSEVTPFVVVSAPQVALRHVNVIDGTGAMSRPDQTVIFTDGRVTAIGPATATPVPQGAHRRCPTWLRKSARDRVARRSGF